MRDPESRQHPPGLVEEYVRMFLRKYAPQRLPPKASEVIAAGPSLGLEEANPAVAPLNCTASKERYPESSPFAM